MSWKPTEAELLAAESVLHECIEDVRTEPDGFWRALGEAVLQAAHDAPQAVGEAMGILSAPINPNGPCAERVDLGVVERYQIEAGR